MATSFRKSEILDLARKDGRVEVDDLAERFGVAVQTIRRDLSALASEGKLSRVHGGAIFPTGVENIQYEVRRRLEADAKAAIGRAIAAEIAPNTALFLNIGTTTEAVARALTGHENITVITNNIHVATILAANPSCEIILTGGTLRRSDGGLVGEVAIEAVRQFKLDTAIIGCSAIDADGDLLDFDLQEVRVSKAILGQARRKILAADASKFQRSAPARIAGLEALDLVVTDRMPDALRNRCAASGTEVRTVQV
ncbi:MAG: DeoR/GlpR family DNA-binding transcription regulator [Pseudomonadota bacterium]